MHELIYLKHTRNISSYSHSWLADATVASASRSASIFNGFDLWRHEKNSLKIGTFFVAQYNVRWSRFGFNAPLFGSQTLLEKHTGSSPYVPPCSQVGLCLSLAAFCLLKVTHRTLEATNGNNFIMMSELHDTTISHCSMWHSLL